MKNKILETGILILFFGSLWGLCEASFGEWLYLRGIPHASVYLTAAALCIIASANVFLSFRWTGAALGFFAMFFKLANIPFFACHLWAILMLGFGYDISRIIIPKLYSGRFKLPVLGFVSAFAGHTLFALTITYVWRYHYWTEAGLPKIIEYIFISGSLSALLGAVTVPAGYRIGVKASNISRTKLHPRLAASGIIAATVGIWVVQQVI